MLTQDYRSIAEIWFVDGKSDDGTFEALQQLRERDARVKILSNPRRLPAAAINLAIHAMNSDALMRLDAHARYRSDAVRLAVEALVATDAGGVGMIAQPEAADTVVGRAIVAAHKSRVGVGVAKFRRADGVGWVDTIWNGCYWKHVIHRVGALREDLWRAEDNDFNARVRALGYGLYLLPGILATYRPRHSLRELWLQYLANGTGAALALFESPRAVAWRHLLPGALVFVLGFPLALGVISHTARLVAAAAWLIYVVLLLVATASAARKEFGAHLLLLPAALATLHIAHGCGFLRGLARRLRRAAPFRTRIGKPSSLT